MPIHKHNPFTVVTMFEEEVAHYTGSPYAISTSNCTNSLLLSCIYCDVKDKDVTIPKKTYISVPQAIKHAGGNVKFESVKWEGIYQLKPFPIYDAAKRFTSGMYIKNTIMCLSFHLKKAIAVSYTHLTLPTNREV